MAGLGIGENSGTVIGSVAKGKIEDAGSFMWLAIGGFVGNNCGTLNSCYADCEAVSRSSGTDLNVNGGFVGYNSKTIINCYSTGSIENNTHYGTGGFVGKNFTGGSISKCFSTTNIAVSTRTNVNYFAGITEDGSTTFKCYYGSNVIVTAYGTSYTPTESAATAKSEIELYSESFLCDTLSWKKDVWNITGTGLPTLLWE